MPEQGRSSGEHGRKGRIGRPLMLLLAAGWLGLLLVLAAGAVQIVAASPSATNPLDCTTGTPTPCPTNTPTLVPTDTPASATATPSSAATDTPASTATDTGGNQGGGVDTGNQNGGAQPTKVVLAQPTVGSGGDGPLQGLTPAAFSSNGLLIATSLSCVVAILGLIVAVVAMYVLVKGGYGPFLKVLVLGKRADGGSGQEAGAAYGAGWDESASWERSGAYEFDYGASARYSAQPARALSRNGNGGNGGVSAPRGGNGGSGGSGGSGTGYSGRNSGPRSGPRPGAPQRSAARTRNLREP